MILIRILITICFAWLLFSYGLSIILTAVFELPDRQKIVDQARGHTNTFALLWSGEIV